MKTLSKLSPIIAVFAALALCGVATAKDIYIAQSAAGAGNGQDCGNARAYTFFNTAANWGTGSSQIGPGTTVHLCGTVTTAANSTALVFHASGTIGNPISLLLESGAILQAPYFAASGNGGGCGGAISMCGFTFITVDGGTNGIVQNTGNGDALANHKLSTGIDAYACTNCTVKNLTIANIYIASGSSIIDETQVRAITLTGSNWVISGNTIHDCGWCLFDAYRNGDANIQIRNNDIYHMGHGLMFATSSSNSAANLIVDSNRFHDTSNWDTSRCDYHVDGIHTFGVTGSSMNGIYISNNYFYGNWGACPTGFVFMEGGSGTPSHASNLVFWNNVGIVPAESVVNTNGWFGLFSGESGTNQIVNNTFIGPNTSDNTSCFSVGSISNLYFENNVISNCGNPVSISSSTFTPSNVDHNFYGLACKNGNNCFVLNSSFTGSLGSWQSACRCDTHSIYSDTSLLNADGSPQAGSPIIGMAANLIALANGSITTLASDTTRGGSRSPLPRALSAAWDIGAYAYSAAGILPPVPPTGLSAIGK